MSRIEGIRSRTEATARDNYVLGAFFSCPHPALPDDPDLDALLDSLDDVEPIETPLPAPANDDALPAIVPGLVTKRVGRARRRKVRTGLRQKQDARDMRAQERHAAGEAVEHLDPLPSHPQTHTDTEKHTPTTTTTSRSANTTGGAPSPTSCTPMTSTKARTRITSSPGRRGRMIAAWDDAGELPRLVAVNRAVAEFGQPFAFSLNLAPDLIQAANDNERGALDYLRRRVALALKRAFGRTPPLWLALETEDSGRLHLHGGLALNDNHGPGRIEAVLAKAGGTWTRKGSAPADVRAQWAPDGWSVYGMKRAARTRRHLREAAGLAPGARVALVSWSDELGKVGRRLHEEARQAIGRR